ncbi:HEAT repeat domain-containing protein [Myxococcus sp. Y35]|uniref:HEAT repeat domain-containing protein n=1 Tax=Pseudomyxococcus flavus TaxID=3115648 RepID=UPI003CFA8EF7
MRPVLLAGLLLATAARAQAPTPPPLASAAPATEPVASASPSDDTALLRGLLGAVKPAPEEIRAMAIEDLALLGDARALDALAVLLWDPNPRIQQAALRAVTLFQHARAEEILANVVRHPRLPDALKIQALNGLIFQRTPTARRAVQDAAVDARLTSGVQNAARTVVSQWDAVRR